MKKLVFTFALFLAFVASALAQNAKYEKAMADNLAALKASKTPQEKQAVMAKFEQIGQTAKTEWTPYYWASYLYCSMSFEQKTLEEKDLLIAQSEKVFEKIEALKVENDEVYVLKALIAQAKLSADPQNRWQTESANFSKNLQIAAKLNAENPRIYFLQGLNTMYTPEAFGGGKKNAMPLFLKAKEKFETFKPASALAPNWGKDRLDKILSEGK